MSQPPLHKVGVIGAGSMGAEIALVHALAGCDVLLGDRDVALAQTAIVRLEKLTDKLVARGLLAQQARDAGLTNVRAVAEGDFADREILIEAVFEQEEVKAAVLQRFDAICPPLCIFATNTSTIPVAVLASYVDAARQPLFVGTHYFSPVSRMPLVEIIPALRTDAATVDKVERLARHVGKTPVLIKDVAGFAVNRLFHALLIEAVRLVEEGVASPSDIDIACQLGLGHPMGPFGLMDATSSSLCLQVQEILQQAYGERFRPRPLLKQRVRAGYGGGRGKPGWL